MMKALLKEMGRTKMKTNSEIRNKRVKNAKDMQAAVRAMMKIESTKMKNKDIVMRKLEVENQTKRQKIEPMMKSDIARIKK